MTGYAAANGLGLGRGPEATYRRIDLAGRTATADGPGLVQLLYTELVQSLRAAAHAAEHRNYPRKSERVTRATAILYALEAGLDFDAGGEVSRTLAGLYAGARREVVKASLGHDPAPFRAVATNLEEIAQAWATVRAG
jgi:flagellar protein FliS